MEDANRRIVVKGIGKISLPPDQVVLDMTLEIIDLDYDESMRRATDLLDALREAIKSAGHEGKMLKTIKFDVDTRYEKRRVDELWEHCFLGYVCTHILQLKFALDARMLSLTLGKIAESNTNPDLTIRFSVKDPNAASEKILESAVEDAKRKAGVLAQSANVSLGCIENINYDWDDLFLYSRSEMKTAQGLSPDVVKYKKAFDIEPDDIALSDTVTVVWAIA